LKKTSFPSSCLHGEKKIKRFITHKNDFDCNDSIGKIEDAAIANE